MKMSRRQSLGRLAGVGVGAAAVWHTGAQAAVFLELEQAQKLLAPQASSFAPLPLALDAAKLAELAAASQTQVPRGYAPRCWVAMAGAQQVGWVLADKAIGKYELIDFAAGFAADASMTGLEVMVYRESHGAEIRNPAWRRQFAGKQGPAQLRFGDDIRNISGATLSCQHVTEAAQRLSVIAQWLRQAHL
jgi:hypothetical protein